MSTMSIMSNVSTICVILEKRYDEIVQKDSPILSEHLASMYPGVPEWLVRQGEPWDYRTFSHAALCGQLDVVKWLKSNGYMWNSETCSKAALGGNINILTWALGNGCPWSDSVNTNAALHGHLEIIKWTFLHKFDELEKVYKTCLTNAAYGGHLDMIVWFYIQGFPMKSSLKSEMYFTASFAGQSDVEKWLKSKGVLFNYNTSSSESSEDSSEEFGYRYKRERYVSGDVKRMDLEFQ